MTIVPNATLIFQAVTFLVLMVILDKMLFKPVLRILDERKARTEGRRQNAAEAEKQAETIWEDYETKIAQARSEAEAVRAELVKQGDGNVSAWRLKISGEVENPLVLKIPDLMKLKQIIQTGFLRWE